MQIGSRLWVSTTGTQLANISTRALVGTGANIIIPGFVISGTGSEQLLARGDGPALTGFGVSGALAQPSLGVFNSSGSVDVYKRQVQVSGVGNSTGVALAEVYEVSSGGTRLANISTRALVGTGANIIIPGFVIAGTGSEQLLARGDGPALTAFGVGGALAQPSLSVFDSSGNVIASKDVYKRQTLYRRDCGRLRRHRSSARGGL